jgi:transposase-like protein
VCGSEALYKYGKVLNGLQRIKCLMCGRSFVPGHVRVILKNRPACPECGKGMHLYRREAESLRFRCSGYPECRVYLKVMNKEAKERGMLRA